MKTEDLLEEIRFAFKNVTREGGVSWSETRVLDDYGSEAERAAARALDKDTTWMEVANNRDWTFNGIGRYEFLDPIGFRYYLPAAMTSVLIREAYVSDLVYALVDNKPQNPSRYCSLLDGRQLACVKHFVKHMVQVTNNTSGDVGWRDIYGSYWKDVPEYRARHENAKARAKKASQSKSG